MQRGLIRSLRTDVLAIRERISFRHFLQTLFGLIHSSIVGTSFPIFAVIFPTYKLGISFVTFSEYPSLLSWVPPWGSGGLSRECAPPYPQRDRKRRLNGAMCRNHRIKRLVRVGARTGTLKNPTKCLWRWEPDRRSYFFFSPPAHLCAVTYMTEISLIVTLNK